MSVALPPAPYRITLAMALAAADRMAEASGSYRCSCGREVMAAGFYDVRDQPENFGGQAFACQTCVSDLLRREEAAYAEEVRRLKESAGILDEERLNDLRATREIALTRSDWTQLADNRARIGSAASAAWDAYRQAVRAWFSTARDTGIIGDFPTAPE